MLIQWHATVLPMHQAHQLTLRPDLLGLHALHERVSTSILPGRILHLQTS